MERETNELDINLSVISDGIREIAPDLLELGIDQFFKEGILKEIPILGTMIKVVKFTQDIIDLANQKKILKFLLELKEIPQKKKEAFLEKLENNDSYKGIGETITLVLCRLDESNKAQIIGKLYKATIAEEIELNDFLRLVFIVEKAFLNDLIELSKNPDIEDPKVLLPLYQAGLFNQVIDDGSPTGVSHRTKAAKLKHNINSFGEQLRRFGF